MHIEAAAVKYICETHLLQIDIVAVLPDAVALYDPGRQQDRDFALQRALQRVSAAANDDTKLTHEIFRTAVAFCDKMGDAVRERADARRAEFECEFE
jgi:hypothetical protein